MFFSEDKIHEAIMNCVVSSLSYLPVTDFIGATLCHSQHFYSVLLTVKSSSLSDSLLDISLTRWLLRQEKSPHEQREQEKIPFFDPHFHIWDMNLHHDPNILVPFNKLLQTFTLKQLEEEYFCSAVSSNLEFIGGVHIEAIAKNFDGISEVKWVQDQIQEYHKSKPAAKSDKIFLASGYLKFDSQDKKKLADDLNFMIDTGVCSLRQILNFEPSWPHIQHNMLEDSDWIETFSNLMNNNDEGSRKKTTMKVFEVQMNPHQFSAAAKNLFSKNPCTKFVINHLGCLTGKDLNSPSFFREFYLRQLQKIANDHVENVFIKLSMLEYAFACDDYDDETKVIDHWSKSPRVRQLVAEVVRIFGIDRCLIASNFPVSLLNQALPPDDDTNNFKLSARVWAEWVCDFLQNGLPNRNAAEKIAARNSLAIYHS